MTTSKRGRYASRNTRTTEINREVLLGRYIAETGATVRQASAKFGVSKSTVHMVVSI
jgi:transposase